MAGSCTDLWGALSSLSGPRSNKTLNKAGTVTAVTEATTEAGAGRLATVATHWIRTCPRRTKPAPIYSAHWQLEWHMHRDLQFRPSVRKRPQLPRVGAPRPGPYSGEGAQNGLGLGAQS